MCFGERLNGSWHDLSVWEGKKYWEGKIQYSEEKQKKNQF